MNDLSSDESESSWTVVKKKSEKRREKKDHKLYFYKDDQKVLFHPVSQIKNYAQRREYAYKVQQTTGDISLLARTLMNDIRCHELEKDGWFVSRVEESQDFLPGDDQYVPFKNKEGKDYWIVFRK